MVGAVQNFSYPSYQLFICDVYKTATHRWNELDSHHKTPVGWYALVMKYSGVTVQDGRFVLSLAVLWTLLRYLMSTFMFKPIIARSQLPSIEAEKAPESAWKLLFYSGTWSYSIYLLFYTRHNFFHDVPSTFAGWSIHSTVPTEIYIAYLVQISFYVHSVFATLFMDVWRKDSVVMLLHHVVTMLLIGFSYAFRYTNVGILVLFLHDVTDILLEGTKLIVYYKTKGGWWYKTCDLLSTLGFILFGVAWYLFRLYWFPLKAMYAAGHISDKLTNNLIFYHFFNALLWVLLAMNVYWFTFIVIMAYKIVTKQVKEIDDTREEMKETSKKMD